MSLCPVADRTSVRLSPARQAGRKKEEQRWSLPVSLLCGRLLPSSLTTDQLPRSSPGPTLRSVSLVLVMFGSEAASASTVNTISRRMDVDYGVDLSRRQSPHVASRPRPSRLGNVDTCLQMAGGMPNWEAFLRMNYLYQARLKE